MPTQRRMNLVAYLKTGPTANHPGGWRHPEADLHDIFEPTRYEHLARVLESARFDAGFFADTFGLPDLHRGGYETYLGLGGQITCLDPLAVLPLMARVTSRLGLGATLSTTFNTPYYLARTLASLDLLTKGRICWNVVTSATDMEARNFGQDGIPPKDERYGRGDEVLEACCALWECWQDDALVLDRSAGRFADPAKVRRADYMGKYVRTRGPLSMPRSPQVRPVFLQAGASPEAATSPPAEPRRSSARPTPRPTPRRSTPTSRPAPKPTAARPGFARCCPRSPSSWAKPARSPRKKRAT